MRMKDGSHVIDIEVDFDANKAELFSGRAQDPASTVSGTKTGEQTKTETPKLGETNALRDPGRGPSRAGRRRCARSRGPHRDGGGGVSSGQATEEDERSEGSQRRAKVKPRALTLAAPHVVYSLREGQRESSGRPRRRVPKHQAAPTAWRSKSSRASKVCCAS